MDTVLGGNAMFFGAALICWLAIPLSAPRVPRWATTGAEQMYTRLLGQQHALRALALLVTLIALIALAMHGPTPVDPDLRMLRRANAQCAEAFSVSNPNDPPTCYALAPGGVWVIEQLQDDHQWVVITTLPARPHLQETGLCEPRCPGP